MAQRLINIDNNEAPQAIVGHHLNRRYGSRTASFAELLAEVTQLVLELLALLQLAQQPAGYHVAYC